MENSDNKLIILLSSSDLYRLEIIKGKLDSEGIQSFIAGKSDTIGFVEGYKLRISSSDLEKATTILNEINK